MKAIALLIATNLAIMVVLGIITSVFQIQGQAYLLVFAVVAGFMGAIISLLMSKKIALWNTGAKILSQPSNSQEYWLLQTVERQALAAGIGKPEVAIYGADEVNAFATGANRNNALVAVSTGLLSRMTQEEVEAVLAHEISHIANGDMVTLTLIQGVVNTFVIYLSSFIARRISDNGWVVMAVNIALQIALGFLASMIVAWFSRQREFRADRGGAHLAGKRKMISALKRLQQGSPAEALPEGMTAMGIRGGDVMKLFATHPPLEARIAALEANS
jgi:heat shock protein HtpX